MPGQAGKVFALTNGWCEMSSRVAIVKWSRDHESNSDLGKQL